MTTLLLYLTLFIVGLTILYAARVWHQSRLAVSSSLREQMDRHDAYRASVIDPLLETDPEMGAFELELWFSNWNRIAERADRFLGRAR